MQLLRMRREDRGRLCAANGGVLREAKTMMADKKTEADMGAALSPRGDTSAEKLFCNLTFQ